MAMFVLEPNFEASPASPLGFAGLQDSGHPCRATLACAETRVTRLCWLRFSGGYGLCHFGDFPLGFSADGSILRYVSGNDHEATLARRES